MNDKINTEQPLISEDYCSYEVAKLLKEKGFKEPCKGLTRIILSDDKPQYKVTHQLAMQWLRVKHNIDIEIDADVGMLGVKVYTPFISTYKSVTDNTNKLRQYKRGLNYKDDKGVVPALQHFPKYEEAVEAALKFCLTKII